MANDRQSSELAPARLGDADILRGHEGEIQTAEGGAPEHEPKVHIV